MINQTKFDKTFFFFFQFIELKIINVQSQHYKSKFFKDINIIA